MSMKVKNDLDIKNYRKSLCDDQLEKFHSQHVYLPMKQDLLLSANTKMLRTSQ